MLYQPEAFEPLTDDPWDEERVRGAIRAIVADADEAFDPDELWPAHEWDSWQSATPMKNLYVGAARGSSGRWTSFAAARSPSRASTYLQPRLARSSAGARSRT